MKKKILIFAIFLLIIGCEEGDTGTHFSNHFVHPYIDVTEISLLESSYGMNIIDIKFIGKSISPPSQRFEELSTQYNDKSYNAYITSNACVSEKVSVISVTCDKDFNAYSAGESLNGIIKFATTSPYKFIQNGYKYPNGEQTPSPDMNIPFELRKGYEPIFKLLSELNSDDLKLIRPRCYLYFTELPTKGEYTFSVSLKVGVKEIKNDITYTFE